jgi:hypothetical protein
MYVISAIYEEYPEDNTIVAIVDSEELANEIKDYLTEYYNPEPCTTISRSQWEIIWEDVVMSESLEDLNFIETAHKLFPQYSIEELELADKYYESVNTKPDEITIQEVAYYNNLSEFKNGIIN